MGKYYRDAKQLYEIYGYFLDRVLSDQKIGKKMSKAKIIIQFIYTDPDAELTIDLRNPLAKEGYFGTVHLGPCDLKPDVWSKQPADHSHSFWHGLENPIKALTRRIVKMGGNTVAIMKLLPVVRPGFALFPVVLAEMGLPELVLEKKKR